MSNQTALHNGCVCDSGCEACDRLAEAFEAMRKTLRQAADLSSTRAGRQGEPMIATYYQETKDAPRPCAHFDCEGLAIVVERTKEPTAFYGICLQHVVAILNQTVHQ